LQNNEITKAQQHSTQIKEIEYPAQLNMNGNTKNNMSNNINNRKIDLFSSTTSFKTLSPMSVSNGSTNGNLYHDDDDDVDGHVI